MSSYAGVRFLAERGWLGHVVPMADNSKREERLAARLRENLKRRKTQARALSAAEGNGDATQNPPPLPISPDGG